MALVSASCSGGGAVGESKPKAAVEKTKAEEPEEDPEEQLPRSVNTTPGSATRLGPLPNRRKYWTVEWKEARLDFSPNGRFAGHMEDVSGVLYDETGKAASTFQSKDGDADKEKDLLRLGGGVKIVSNEHKATLICDKVEYLPERGRVRALGNVRIETVNGVLDAGNEILATPDLRHVATPNLFRP